MDVLRKMYIHPEEEQVVAQWRLNLCSEAKIKKIPNALLSCYVNEKVYHWIQDQNIFQFPDEYNLLISYFPPTNWESISIHESKIAVILCAHVDYHCFESALNRVREKDFMSQFMVAHSRDRLKEKLFMMNLGNISDIYEGRSIKELYSNFLQDQL
jgi:hypothetical protein